MFNFWRVGILEIVRLLVICLKGFVIKKIFFEVMLIVVSDLFSIVMLLNFMFLVNLVVRIMFLVYVV